MGDSDVCAVRRSCRDPTAGSERGTYGHVRELDISLQLHFRAAVAGSSCQESSVTVISSLLLP